MRTPKVYIETVTDVTVIEPPAGKFFTYVKIINWHESGGDLYVTLNDDNDASFILDGEAQQIFENFGIHKIHLATYSGVTAPVEVIVGY